MPCTFVSLYTLLMLYIPHFDTERKQIYENVATSCTVNFPEQSDQTLEI